MWKIWKKVNKLQEKDNKVPEIRVKELKTPRLLFFLEKRRRNKIIKCNIRKRESIDILMDFMYDYYTKNSEIKKGGYEMKKKQLLALGLSVLMAVGAFAGCGSAPAKEESKDTGKDAGAEEAGDEKVSGEVRYAFWDAAQQPYLEKCVEEFNKIYPDIKVTLEPNVWDEYWTKLEAGATGGSIADVFWMNGPNITKYAKGDILMLKVTLEPNVWDEYWTKLEAGATGGSIADVFWMNGPNITKYAKGDILMPIDDLLKDSELDTANYPQGLVELYNIDGSQYALPKDFDTIGVWYNKKIFDEAGVDSELDTANYPQGLVELYNIDGSQYALPKDFDTIGVWYNKKIFDEAGVPYPTDDWTWEDMTETAKQLTKSDGSVYGIGAPYDTQVGIYNTIYAAGGEVISENKKSSGYDKPETQAGIQCWIDLQKAGVSPSEASLEETAGNIQFLSGRLGSICKKQVCHRVKRLWKRQQETFSSCLDVWVCIGAVPGW